jgi:hypothetical protein
MISIQYPFNDNHRRLQSHKNAYAKKDYNDVVVIIFRIQNEDYIMFLRIISDLSDVSIFTQVVYCSLPRSYHSIRSYEETGETDRNIPA